MTRTQRPGEAGGKAQRRGFGDEPTLLPLDGRGLRTPAGPHNNLLVLENRFVPPGLRNYFKGRASEKSCTVT